MEEISIKKILFPHSEMRKVQEDLIRDVLNSVKKKSHLIAHAPTGMGKTAATLSPCLSEAIDKKDIVIFFLTSRHTQHQIALTTLREISSRHKANFGAVSIIGKKWMCAMPETASLYSKDFIAFCKAMRDDDKCEFYSNIGSRTKPSISCQKALKQIAAVSPVETKRIVSVCTKEKLCPYEMAILLASSAKVIVTDYFYLIDPFIREIFLKKIGRSIEKSIIIFDEGHNLPSRVRDLMTVKISTFIVERAVKEAQKYRFEDAEMYLLEIKEALVSFAKAMPAGGEQLIAKDEFLKRIGQIKDYDEISAALEFAADEVRESERSSYIGSVALFMEHWEGPDQGRVRILSKDPTKYGDMVTITYRCLDPSVFTKDIIARSHSTIIMSGTLTPTAMYRDLLGFPENTVEKIYPSPFPQDNRLVMIVPKTTTKFTKRSESQFRDIASICIEIAELVPGSTALFFPSYGLMEKMKEQIIKGCSRPVFIEDPKMDKEQKHRFLENFKKSAGGAVLLGVTSGSFGEGVDIPGNILKAVVVVGMPLDKPRLETRELIKYYDEKFGKGWDYGYIMPAITRAMQNAGRCIRSEKDKGVMIFLDERYSMPGYIKCFPEDWDIKITVDYKERINQFFGNTLK